MAELLPLGLALLGGAADIWTLQKAIKTKEPKLVIEKIYVRNFSFYPTYEVRRFIIARVRNVGESTATNCIGTLISRDTPKGEFKLHWADIPYAPLRDSTTPIDIKPNETRDLDIAFSVGGIMDDAETQTLTSSPTYLSDSHISSSNVSTMGTFDPSKYTEEYMISEPSGGSWVATPFALLTCKTVKEDYMKPGNYLARVQLITDTKDQGDEKLIVINSSPEWHKLNAKVI